MNELNLAPCDAPLRPEPGERQLLDRRSAAARLGVTAGRFEQLIRDEVVPDPVVVNGGRFWDAASLDQVRGAVEQLGKAFVYAERTDTAPSAEQTASSDDRQPDEIRPPDRAVAARARRSFPSQNEISLLREFKLAGSDQISMFGCYRSFEALIARGYLVEVSRSGPSSRQLVTYRLTESGTKVVAALKDA